MCWASGVLTHVKMEKKEKVMAARAASVPSFIGLSFGLDTCHWLARKQKPTNQRKAQKAGVFTGARQEGEWGGPGRGSGAHLPRSPTPKGRGGGRGGQRRAHREGEARVGRSVRHGVGQRPQKGAGPVGTAQP